MTKCPYCGSSAQFKISTPLYFEDGVWKQQKKCGCGCIVVLRFEEKMDKIHYPQSDEPPSPLALQMIQALNAKHN